MSDVPRRPDADSEARLDELRREAERSGEVADAGVRPAGAPFPSPPGDLDGDDDGATGRLPEPGPEHGYYAQPVLKAPVWTWEVPLYFAVGGAAGAAGAFAAVIDWLGPTTVAAAAMAWHAHLVAVVGVVLSTVLLIADLGRPARFLGMLRIFKWRSPMSVGAWGLAAFGGTASLATFAHAGAAWGLPTPFSPSAATWHRADLALGLVAGLLGLKLATYTAVLLAVSAVPVWAGHRASLPIHFGAAAVGSAAAVLELLGHLNGATAAVGLAAATAETLLALWLEFRRHDWDSPLRRGRSGMLIRIGALLAGPFPLALRLASAAPSARMVAAAAFVAGAVVSRYGWLAAGRASAADPGAALGFGRPRRGD